MVLRSSATPRASGEHYHRGASPPFRRRSAGSTGCGQPARPHRDVRGSGGFPDAYGPQREQSHRFNGKKTVEGRWGSRQVAAEPSPHPRSTRAARTSASRSLGVEGRGGGAEGERLASGPVRRPSRRRPAMCQCGAMPLAVSSLIAFAFFDRCASPIPRSTFAALVN